MFEDDNGRTVHPTFQLGDTLLTDLKIFLPKIKGRKFGTGLDKKQYPSEPKSRLDPRCLGSTKEVSRCSRRWGCGGLTARGLRGS